MTRISVVLPCFNAAAVLSRTMAELLAWIDAAAEEVELIVVDDGSADRTAQLAAELLAERPACHVIRNDRNMGKGHAVKRGVAQATGELVLFTDADLAYPPSELTRIASALRQGADVAIASRVSPESRHTITPELLAYFYTRHLASRAFNLFVRCLLGFPYRDTQAGLKGFTAATARQLFDSLTVHGFAFDVELLYTAHRRGLTVREVPVHYRYRTEPSTVRFLTSGLQGLRDVLRVRWRGLRGRYPSGR